MTETNKRKLLKGITVGTSAIVAGKALPDAWTKPVINSVMLPAHASTTENAGTLPQEATTPPVATTLFCSIAGVFCDGGITITVLADGTVTAVLESGPDVFLPFSGTSSVNPDLGGTFVIETTSSNEVSVAITIRGEVICNSTTLDATITFGQDGPYVFSGTQSAC